MICVLDTLQVIEESCILEHNEELSFLRRRTKRHRISDLVAVRYKAHEQTLLTDTQAHAETAVHIPNSRNPQKVTTLLGMIKGK